MRRLTALAAAFLAAAPGLANAAEPPCLTPGEFTSMTSYALPSIIAGTAQRCSTSLPANAFLMTGGKGLAARYAAQKGKHWPGAKAAFLKLGNSADSDAGKLFRGMPDTSLQPILEGMVEGMVSQQIPLDRCGAIDRLVMLLSPLPAENTAEAIAIAVGLGTKTGGGPTKLGKLSICKA